MDLGVQGFRGFGVLGFIVAKDLLPTKPLINTMQPSQNPVGPK